jgi:imidazolonepropionase-like amidohydrolase
MWLNADIFSKGNSMKKFLIFALVLLPVCSFADIYVNCPRLLDGESEAIHTNKTIHISGNRIVGLLDGFVAGTIDDTTVKLDDQTCMPGLIDAHVHITSQQSPTRFVDRFRLDPAEKILAAVPYAERTLMAGFTTVRDLGSADNLSINMRDAINKGHIKGPRIYTAGKSLATTGGHADPTNGTNARLRGDPGPKDGVVNSPSDAKKAVRQRYKDRADLIKITATGGVLSQATSGQNSQFTDEELEAIISIAKDYHFKVAAHAHGTEGMKRAVAAGVDSIEHGTYMDLATMKLMKKKGTAYVPTIIAGKFVAEKAEVDGYFSEVVRPKAREIGPLIQETFAKAYAEGVHIVFGTDTGVSPHGDNWKEFGYMVEAGMPEIEALNSAMKVGAELLDIDADLGTIEPGMLADVIAVKGNPTQNINQMEFVELVIKDGRIYKNQP